METVYRKTDLLSERQDLEQRIKELQNKRGAVLRSAMKSTDNVNDLEELTLRLEKVDWKLNALF
jgi:hypothetical protein